MKISFLRKSPFFTIAVIFVLTCGICVWANPIIFHMAYAAVEAPVCASRVAKQINVAPNHSAIIGYIETSVTAGTPLDTVHRTLEDVAPIVVHPYENYPGGDYEEIVVLMCSEPLNNLVIEAAYTEDGKLIAIEHDSLP